VKDELNKEVVKLRQQGMVADPVKLKEVEDNAVGFVYLVAGGTMLLGGVFIVLGLVIKRFPVPATVISLTLYITAAVVFAILNPMTMAGGLIIKVIVVIALVKAIMAAVAYERGRDISGNLRPSHE
jgi:hypothetical protein